MNLIRSAICMNNNPYWLSELEGAVPEAAYGISINVYTIAFEAWRRGLSVSFENVYSKSRGRHFIRYIIGNRQKNVKFTHNRSELVSQKAVRTVANKIATRKILASKDIPAVRSGIVNTADLDAIKNITSDFNYPVKITELASSSKNKRTVTKGSPEEVSKFIAKQKKNAKYKGFLLEESAEKTHYYAYIVDDKVIGVYKKETPFITGDGSRSINELLKESNIVRSRVPSIINLEISADEKLENVLKKQNYKIDSVPGSGEKVAIKSETESKDPVDVSDIFSEEMKDNLVNVIGAFPGLIQGEVEFHYDQDTEDYSVLSINGRPGIRNYLYPMQGKARPVPKAIIDYYFPETKGKYLNDKTPKFYFDYESVNDGLRNNRLSRILIPKHRYEPNLVSKSIKFQSKYELKKLKKMIKDNFIRLKFDGEFNVLDDNLFELTIVGNYQDVAYFYDYLQTKKYLNDISTADYDSGVCIGYSFNDLRSSEPETSDKMLKKTDIAKADKEKSSRQIRQYKKKICQRNDRITALEQEIENLKNSKSWKVTEPVRKIRSKFGR